MSQLALFETARQALAEARRIDEVRDVRDQAERLKLYARQARDRHLMADASEIIARAERRLGQILADVKAAGQLSAGGRPGKTEAVPEPETGDQSEPVSETDTAGAQTVTLAELGISKKLSSAAQRLAEDYAEDEAFEAELERRREKAMADGATVIRPTRKKSATAKAQPVEPLPNRRFHQFVFSMIAMSMSGVSVSNETIQFLAAETGILTIDGEVIDFTPEALAAFGTLADAALKAIAGDEDPEAKANDDAAGETAPLFLSPDAPFRDPLDIEDEDGALPVAAPAPMSFICSGPAQPQLPRSGPAQPLSTAAADEVIRAGYARGDSLLAIAETVGRPGNKNYVGNRARVMKITSPERQRAAASAFATAQHAARRSVRNERQPGPEQGS